MSSIPKINSDEEIKFVATYDRAVGSVQIIPGYQGGNLGDILDVAGVCSFSFISINFLSTGPGIPGAPAFADETYSVVSYPNVGKNLPKLGSVIWSGTYREQLSQDGTTPPSVQDFAVIGASGIYSDVTRVIVDFNNIIRVVYLIGPKSI